MRKLRTILIGGSLLPILFGVIFIVLIGGISGGIGKDPNLIELQNISISDIGFPYNEGIPVTLTQGYWLELPEATQWWGSATPPYARGCHPAVDYSAGYSTEILNILPGEVVYVGSDAAFGNHVIIKSILDDGSELYVLYAHFSEVLTYIGESKVLGSTIGREGNTGISTSSHLHLEISREFTGYSLGGDPRERINYLDLIS